MRQAKPCNALLALSATNPAAKSLQRKSCKVSKIKKPGDGANNTTHSLCLAVISDYSGQVLTVYCRGSLVVSIDICNATWQSIQVRAYEHLASYQHKHTYTYLLGSSSSMKNSLWIPHAAVATSYAPCESSPHGYLAHTNH